LKLRELAITYFKRRGYNIELDVIIEGMSGVQRKFDMIVSREGEKRPVWIKDWKRTVGVNIAIGLDKASADVGLKDPILIANKFSDHAKAYAKRKRIDLLTSRDLIM